MSLLKNIYKHKKSDIPSHTKKQCICFVLFPLVETIFSHQRENDKSSHPPSLIFLPRKVIPENKLPKGMLLPLPSPLSPLFSPPFPFAPLSSRPCPTLMASLPLAPLSSRPCSTLMASLPLAPLSSRPCSTLMASLPHGADPLPPSSRCNYGR